MKKIINYIFFILFLLSFSFADDNLTNEAIVEDNIFTIDTQDTLTIYIILLMIIASIIIAIFMKQVLIASSILLIVGLILLFNSFNIVLSLIILLIGFVGLFA